jgi:hypothetical protein
VVLGAWRWRVGVARGVFGDLNEGYGVRAFRDGAGNSLEDLGVLAAPSMAGEGGQEEDEFVPAVHPVAHPFGHGVGRVPDDGIAENPAVVLERKRDPPG